LESGTDIVSLENIQFFKNKIMKKLLTILALLTAASTVLYAQRNNVEQRGRESIEQPAENLGKQLEQEKEFIRQENERLKEDIKRHEEHMRETAKKQAEFDREFMHNQQEARREAMLKQMEMERDAIQKEREQIREEMKRRDEAIREHQKREDEYYRELEKADREFHREEMLKAREAEREAIQKENEWLREEMHEQDEFYREQLKDDMEFERERAKKAAEMERKALKEEKKIRREEMKRSKALNFKTMIKGIVEDEEELLGTFVDGGSMPLNKHSFVSDELNQKKAEKTAFKAAADALRETGGDTEMNVKFRLNQTGNIFYSTTSELLQADTKKLFDSVTVLFVAVAQALKGKGKDLFDYDAA
jgi:hypothetical protein